MKIAFAGKGGVGKTTLAALFIRALSKDAEAVLAVDCDPVANLGRLIGIKDADKIVPIVEMKELINERTGASPDRSFYQLNPKVDDIPDKFSKNKDNVKLIVMGTVKAGGSGCMCPESTFLKALLNKLLLSKDEAVVMDMEAGIEHLGRATANSVGHLLVVVEPSLGSMNAAKKISRLAAEIGIKDISVILNKMKNKKEMDFVRDGISPLSLIGSVPFDEKIAEFETGKKIDMEGTSAYSAVLEIKNKVVKTMEV